MFIKYNDYSSQPAIAETKEVSTKGNTSGNKDIVFTDLFGKEHTISVFALYSITDVMPDLD